MNTPWVLLFIPIGFLAAIGAMFVLAQLQYEWLMFNHKIWRVRKAIAQDFDDITDTWHQNNFGSPLWEHLGLSENEFARWVQNPKKIPFRYYVAYWREV